MVHPDSRASQSGASGEISLTPDGIKEFAAANFTFANDYRKGNVPIGELGCIPLSEIPIEPGNEEIQNLPWYKSVLVIYPQANKALLRIRSNNEHFIIRTNDKISLDSATVLGFSAKEYPVGINGAGRSIKGIHFFHAAAPDGSGWGGEGFVAGFSPDGKLIGDHQAEINPVSIVAFAGAEARLLQFEQHYHGFIIG
jgi:hypothetical protein